jgi:hypothetical protein
MNQTPSHDAASEGNFPATIIAVLKKFMQGMDDMLPATVVNYDRATNRAIVQPLIALTLTGGSQMSRAPFASIPVMQFGGGGFVLSFPIKPGNLGWIKANDRDISLFAQSFSEAAPNTERLHSFSDGVFIPDVMKGYAIAGEDIDNAVLQNLDGTVRVSLWPDKIKMTAPLVEIDGALHVTQQITSGVGVNVGDIELTEHKHENVQPGSGNSGGPIS